MLSIFRAASLLEGLSFLLILSVSTGLVSRDHVFVLGMGHGVLFLVYLGLSLGASHKQAWPVFTWLLVFLASVVPFAFIAVDFFIKKELAKNKLGTT